MISIRARVGVLGMAALPGVLAMAFREAVAQESTPADQRATPAAIPTPAGPQRTDGLYQLPDNPSDIVIEIQFGNFSLPPQYQYGYEVSIDASGQAMATIYPEGSREEPDSDQVIEHQATLSEDELQGLIEELDTLRFFSLPTTSDASDSPVGGEVDAVAVTLADGAWRVDAWNLDEHQQQFAAAHEVILGAIGIDNLPNLRD